MVAQNVMLEDNVREPADLIVVGAGHESHVLISLCRLVLCQ